MADVPFSPLYSRYEDRVTLLAALSIGTLVRLPLSAPEVGMVFWSLGKDGTPLIELRKVVGYHDRGHLGTEGVTAGLQFATAPFEGFGVAVEGSLYLLGRDFFKLIGEQWELVPCTLIAISSDAGGAVEVHCVIRRGRPGERILSAAERTVAAPAASLSRCSDSHARRSPPQVGLLACS